MAAWLWVVGDATINGSETLTSFKQAIYFKEQCGFNVHDTMIYQKKGATGEYLWRYYHVYEYMFVLSKNDIKTFNPIKDRKNIHYKQSGQITSRRQPDGTLRHTARNDSTREYGKRFNIWSYGIGNMNGTRDKIAFEHPATFPEALARDHILSWSNPGDIVFDPFMGSGTTAKMAYHTQRHYLGFEISQEYIDIANERLRQRTLFEAA